MTDLALKPTAHPCLPVFTDAELRVLMLHPDGANEYARWFNERERLIKLAAADQLHVVFRNQDFLHQQRLSAFDCFQFALALDQISQLFLSDVLGRDAQGQSGAAIKVTSHSASPVP